MKTLRGLLIRLVILIVALVVLFPLIFTISASFMGEREITENYLQLNSSGAAGNPFHIIPDMVTLSGYGTMLTETPQYLMKFWISLGLCLIITLGQLLIAVLGGYAFAKFRFPGRDIMFLCIIIIMMMPHQVTLVPSYMVISRMNLMGSYWAIILPGFFSAFGVFLMRHVIAVFPDSLIDSAKIDGAGNLRVLFRVILPSSIAGVTSLAVLCFLDSWNMVEQPLVFLKETHMYPLSVFLLQVVSYEPALSFACGVLSMFPAVMILLYFEKELVQGISYSVVK